MEIEKLIHKCIEIYKEDLIQQGINKHDEVFIHDIFKRKSSDQLKRFIKISKR